MTIGTLIPRQTDSDPIGSEPGKSRNRRGEAGFTLLELVMVMALMMITSTLATYSLRHAKERARLAVFYSDVRLAKIAAQRFEHDVGFFPLDVARGVDPGMVEKYGWQDGAHSAEWEVADASGMLDMWNGPYLKEWRENPWGGLYEWDNYPPGYDYMGIEGGTVYLSLKPSNGGGTAGMPTSEYEEQLERLGIDKMDAPNVVSIYVGRYASQAPAPSK